MVVCTFSDLKLRRIEVVVEGEKVGPPQIDVHVAASGGGDTDSISLAPTWSFRFMWESIPASSSWIPDSLATPLTRSEDGVRRAFPAFAVGH